MVNYRQKKVYNIGHSTRPRTQDLDPDEATSQAREDLNMTIDLLGVNVIKLFTAVIYK
jgi:hypothetical protein